MSVEQLGDQWAWVPSPRHFAVPDSSDNPSLHKFIKQTIEADLAMRGCMEVDARLAEVWIDYFVGHQKKLFHYSGASFSEYDEGALIIDLINPQTHQLMWRGIATARLHESDDPAKRQNRIRRAVTKLLDQLSWHK